MVLLIKCEVPECSSECYGDSIEVETESFATIEEARERMRTEVLQLVDEANKEINEDWKAYEGRDDICYVVDGEDYEIKEDGAWLDWPYPQKWKIVEA